MPAKTLSSPYRELSPKFKRLSEENQELHQYAKKILQNMGMEGTTEHKKFVQELLTKYAPISKKKETYSQDWSAYNESQQREKVLLMNILDELLDYIPFSQKKGVGRNPVPLRDKIFYVALQAYNIKSSRRCISDLEITKKLGFIENAPHFNTVLKCLKDPSLTKYLKHIIQVSGLPLQQIETDFAVDSSGFSTSQFGRWFDVRIGSNSEKRKFVKVHLTCGVKTNIITALNITKGSSADSPEFQELVKDTSKLYEVREVSADKAYSSRENLQTVADLGAIPFIPFRRSTKSNTKTKGYDIWKKMYRFFTAYPDEFAHHYHKRSNVETCFHMLKRKFGSHLRSRHETGQTNEILSKCLCHNLCVLIQEALEIGIDLDFKKCAEIPIAHK